MSARPFLTTASGIERLSGPAIPANTRIYPQNPANCDFSRFAIPDFYLRVSVLYLQHLSIYHTIIPPVVTTV